MKKIQEYFCSAYTGNAGNSPTPFGIGQVERKSLPPTTEPSSYLSDYAIINRTELSPDKSTSDTSNDDSDSDYGDNVRDSELIEVVKSARLKYSVAKRLACKAKASVQSVTKNLYMTKSILLLLTNPSYGTSCDDVHSTEDRLDALLHGYGFQRIAMATDGDCLFSAVSFQLKNRLNSGTDNDIPMKQHLKEMGIAPEQDLQKTVTILRQRIVQEFLDVSNSEYRSYLVASDRNDFEDTAQHFSERGFFDCELGNAVPLALANYSSSAYCYLHIP